jgi:hypothetical protein
MCWYCYSLWEQMHPIPCENWLNNYESTVHSYSRFKPVSDLYLKKWIMYIIKLFVQKKFFPSFTFTFPWVLNLSL